MFGLSCRFFGRKGGSEIVCIVEEVVPWVEVVVVQEVVLGVLQGSVGMVRRRGSHRRCRQISGCVVEIMRWSFGHQDLQLVRILDRSSAVCGILLFP